MTLSNFEWTDKDSVKWFILGPLGHMGPYSLGQLQHLLETKKMSPEVKVWAEGLTDGVSIHEALERSTNIPKVEVPDLPPLPQEDVPPIPTEEVPPLPFADEIIEGEEQHVPENQSRKIPAWAFVTCPLFLMFFFAFHTFMSGQENISINRLPKMPVELHERIQKENTFSGWNKKIFFREYLPHDHSHIWLVTSSFQECDVEATFHSVKDKLLTMDDERVAFKARSRLAGHVVEFSSLDFSEGSKIVPGLYEMDIKATNCEWNGFTSKLMNKFQGPDSEYLARTKVVLFSKGAAEFNNVLDKLLKKKLEIELRKQNENELFWQDLNQKLETLQAITLQIEQHVLDFLQNDPRAFRKNVKSMVDEYTRKYGSFLTSFVVENENYFKTLKYEGKGSSEKRNYELMVRLTSKKIGFESMKFIEEFQGIKKTPRKRDLQALQERVKKVFAGIKSEIGQKLIKVSEDRSK